MSETPKADKLRALIEEHVPTLPLLLIQETQIEAACNAVIAMRDMLEKDPKLEPWDACARMLEKLEPGC